MGRFIRLFKWLLGLHTRRQKADNIQDFDARLSAIEGQLEDIQNTLNRLSDPSRENLSKGLILFTIGVPLLMIGLFLRSDDEWAAYTAVGAVWFIASLYFRYRAKCDK